MATQIFELGTYLPKGAPRDVLSKEEALAFCAGFGQQHPELEAFMARHDFDQWRCVGVDIYDQYCANNDPDGHLDCSPPSILGILITSMNSEAPERALRKYSNPGVDIKYTFDSNYEVLLDHLPTCPLWICEVKRSEKHRLDAVVLLPEAFWHADGPDCDSYGYPYTVEYPGSYNYWYWGGRDVSFRALRMGSFSQNELTTDGREIPFDYKRPHYDAALDRLFLTDEYASEAVTYFDLGDDLVAKKFPLDICTGMAIKEDCYRFYTKKALIVTDKSLVETGKLTAKTGLPKGNKGRQEFEGGGWKVMVTQSGLSLQSPEAETVSKLSTYKLNSYSSTATHSMMSTDAKGRLVIVAGQIALVNPDLSLSSISLKKAFKKEIQPILGEHFVTKDSNSANGVLQWPKGEQWFFLNALVFSLNEKDEPQLLNQQLKKLCGEFVFHGGVYDAELKGVWLLAGLGRIVFMPQKKDKAYLFNVPGGSYGKAAYQNYLNFDKHHNLWFGTKHNGILRCILRGELKAKLKGAVAFGA